MTEVLTSFGFAVDRCPTPNSLRTMRGENVAKYGAEIIAHWRAAERVVERFPQKAWILDEPIVVGFGGDGGPAGMDIDGTFCDGSLFVQAVEWTPEPPHDPEAFAAAAH